MNGMLAVVRYQADATRRPDGIVSFHRAEELMYTILLDRAAAAYSSKRKKAGYLVRLCKRWTMLPDGITRLCLRL